MCYLGAMARAIVSAFARKAERRDVAAAMKYPIELRVFWLADDALKEWMKALTSAMN